MNETKKSNFKRVLLALGAALMLLPAAQVSAVDDGSANQESILLSPTSKRYALDAGTTQRDSFKVVNDGKTEYLFVVYARPYSINNENYAPDFTNQAQNADAYKWVQFDQPSYQIKAGETIEVGYTLRVPANATPGGHYGVLFAETQQDAGQTTGTTILRKKRVGAILYVTVNGDIKQSGKFEGTDTPFFQFKAPINIRQRISNSGNTDFQVASTVKVSDVFGGLKYSAEKENTVLPSSTRAINNDWINPAWLGIYKVEQKAKFLDTDKTSSSYVLLVPIWVYATLGLLITGRVLYAIVRRRGHKRKK